jgi:HK97 family phage prohead protease
MMHPINIPGADRIRAKTTKWLNRSRPERRAPEQVVFTNADGSTNSAPALQGVACVYDKLFDFDGRTVMFAYGCFGNVYDPGIERQLLFDHDAGNVIGTTVDGLTFANSPDGLVYRLPLAGNARAAEVKALVESSKKACASVGCRIAESTTTIVDGETVDVITKAELFETSIVFWGKVNGTSASIVDLSRVDADVRDESKSLDFAIDKLASNMATNAKHAAHQIALLNEAIGNYEAAPAQRATSVMPATIARWHTAETEARQAAVR